MAIVALLGELIEDMLLSSIPALGFAMVFNVPRRALVYCALLGSIGHGSRFLLLKLLPGIPIEWATFAASILIGFIGIRWSRWLLSHPKVFTVAAVIPMFPGIYAYDAMISVVQLSQQGYSQELFALVVTNFLKALFTVGALSLGLSLAGIWIYRKRPEV